MRLFEYIEILQSEGRLWFTKSEALNTLNCSSTALKKAVERLQKKNKLVVIKQIFILIIPVEYKDRGMLPADWFIDPLMQALNLPYYVSLLTAGQLYGAAHQKPMRFQVITNKVLKPIKHDKVVIHFYVNDKLAMIPTKKIQSRSGYLNVSTPEATALDLCAYYKKCGYLSNVATVLAELHESIDPKKLYDLAVREVYPIAIIQRLGYLLSLPEVDATNLAQVLVKVVEKTNPRWVPLEPGCKVNTANKDPVWRIYINSEIEVDEI